ncbi:MAG TPA: exodeoxyribonuclease V subunit alpha [Acidimicrobiales bacterium]|nr:exodeoxyribonuclease V subunit alpha [Acidimicrobiales bacterium]
MTDVAHLTDEAGTPLDRPGRRDGRGSDLLDIFAEGLVLAPADVHVARGLGRLGGEADPSVLLAAALAVRAPRLGHVCVDLATVAATTTSDADETVDVAALPWPAPAGWLERLACSPLVGGDDGGPDPDRPLRLAGTLLYLDRYWRQERAVAGDLLARDGAIPVDRAVLDDGLDRLFGRAASGAPGAPGVPAGEADLQRTAAEVAASRRLVVVAGGPGTGKTTTVARLVALMDEQAAAAGQPPPRVALAAPTGKAAARLAEGVHREAATLDVSDATRSRLLQLPASTLHRLLGTRPDSRSRFRHDRGNHLPYDTVVVDETSMVPLSLMSRLLEALRPDTRLVLLGDPDQLTSVEAGAVLGDIVGPAGDGGAGNIIGPGGDGVGGDIAGPGGDGVGDSPAGGGLRDAIVVLRHVHRFSGGIAQLAAAIKAGDEEAAIAALREHPDSVIWHPDADHAGEVQQTWVDAGRDVFETADAGDAAGALAAVGRTRVLCAHRLGPDGVATWQQTVESWLAQALPGYGAGGRWYVGRPLLVTRNDYGLGLSNGDVGVVVRTGAGVAAAFTRAGEVVLFPPTRLEAVESVHAMTIHKSQGSQFDTVAVVLPEPGSRILTRQLLYTAVTRARRHVHLIGDETRLRAGVARSVARASGLGPRLWPSGGGST